MDVVVTVFATVAAVASTVNMQGALGEVQSITMLASHGCAAPEAAACLAHMDWTLTPVAFGPPEAPGLYGSFTVVASFVALHMIVCSVVKLAQGRLSDALTDEERWDIAAAKTLYPQLSLLVFAFFYQGIILRTFQNYFAGKSGGFGFGVSFVTGAFSLMLAVLLVWYSLRKTVKCEYQPLSELRRLRRRTWIETKLILPDGTWTTLPYLFRMGAAIFPYRPSRVVFCVVPWVRMFALGFIAAALETSCTAMFALSGVVFAVGLVLTAVLRPYRFGLGLVVSALGHVTGIVVCILGLAQVALPCPFYMVVAAIAAALCIALGGVGYYEQRNYRPEAEALEMQRTGAAQNPLMGYL